MNNKNNVKAFTMIELLGVIVILGILSAIIVPAVTNYMEKSKLEYDIDLGNQLKLMGKNYYSNNPKKMPKINGGVGYVTAEEMATQNLLSKKLVNSKGEDCSSSYVVISNSNRNYKYTGCLVCDGKAYNPSSNENMKSECQIKPQKNQGYYIVYKKSDDPQVADSIDGTETIYYGPLAYDQSLTLSTIEGLGWKSKYYQFMGFKNDKIGTLKEGENLTIKQAEKTQKLTQSSPDLIKLSGYWEKRPTCQVVKEPDGCTNGNVTVKVGCKEEDECKSIENTYSENKTYYVTITNSKGATRECKVEIDNINTTPPTPPTLKRDKCDKNITIDITNSTNKCQKIEYYAWSNSANTPATWTSYNGSIQQPQLNGTVYLHLKDAAGNTTVSNSNSVTTYTNCTSGCGKTTKEVKTYRWGKQTSSSCSSTNHSRTFSFRWYNCKCSMDKVTGEYCSHTQSENTAHPKSASIYYKSTTACTNATSHYNSGIREVCDSTDYYPANSAKIGYHGYYFYNASTPELPYNQFKLGYWYHNGSNINMLYYGGVDDYSAACQHACKVS